MFKKAILSLTFSELTAIITLFFGIVCCPYFFPSPAFAQSNSTGTEQRQDTVMGTFTEGMEMGRDEDGNIIIRSAPSPKDPPKEQEQPPILIEIHPQVTAPAK